MIRFLRMLIPHIICGIFLIASIILLDFIIVHKSVFQNTIYWLCITIVLSSLLVCISQLTQVFCVTICIIVIFLDDIFKMRKLKNV